MPSAVKSVWEKHPALVWSNRRADDTVRLRAALTRPRFDVLLDLAVAFGLERLRQEWARLEEEAGQEIRIAAPVVTRIFRNIEEGFHRADSGN
jgi:hypothetical protein